MPLHPAYGSQSGTDASKCCADSACDCPTHLSVSRLPPPTHPHRRRHGGAAQWWALQGKLCNLRKRQASTPCCAPGRGLTAHTLSLHGSRAFTNHLETGDKEPAPHIFQPASHRSQRQGRGAGRAGLGGFLLPQEGRRLPGGQERPDCLNGGCILDDGLVETEERSLPGSAAEEGQNHSRRQTGATELGPGHLPPPDLITATFYRTWPILSARLL